MTLDNELDRLSLFSLHFPPACFTEDGDSCTFPFEYKDVVYDKCMTIDEPRPWCSHNTDSNGEHISGNWGFCETDKGCRFGERVLVTRDGLYVQLPLREKDKG